MIESVTNDIIDGYGISAYPQIKREVNNEISDYLRELLRCEESKMDRIKTNSWFISVTTETSI